MISLFCDNEQRWLHHAFVARGMSYEDLSDFFSNLGYSSADSDIRHFKETLLSIEVARSAIEASYVRPVSERKRVIVIEAETLSLPAQNALLKLLEEPPTQTVIILLLPHGIPLLPTVESRICEVGIISTDEVGNIESFLNQSPAERLLAWADYSQDKGVLRKFFAAISSHLSDSQCENEFLEINDAFVRGILAPKYAFEAMCLLVPTTKK